MPQARCWGARTGCKKKLCDEYWRGEYKLCRGGFTLTSSHLPPCEEEFFTQRFTQRISGLCWKLCGLNWSAVISNVYLRLSTLNRSSLPSPNCSISENPSPLARAGTQQLPGWALYQLLALAPHFSVSWKQVQLTHFRARKSQRNHHRNCNAKTRFLYNSHSQ